MQTQKYHLGFLHPKRMFLYKWTRWSIMWITNMKKKWTALELKEYWKLSSQELDFTKSKSRKSRLAFAFLLKYFQANIHFPQ